MPEIKNKHTTRAGVLMVAAAAANVAWVAYSGGNMTSAMELLGMAAIGGYGFAKSTDGSL